MEGQTDGRYISAFHGIATNKDLVEHQIAKMKLLMKDDPSNSRFIKVNYTCKYSKNTIFNLTNKDIVEHQIAKMKLLMKDDQVTVGSSR